ncbi:G-protein coupled receptors family 1 profile domain-containing protein [Caenorhabditis elegans]|uniref:G-protein coupled receptors family 1 profile domain-containing protein n=1 Tax=Caenorhabditis elegans TaxID=6239 RepID=Q94219_CAEEL|nr:G-protein coupled receptors family 1 profile domain-containing protein [Caenorhabditis elegans]CCD64788.1 G-protein coupled receptors family 1 profile domain-containing protein [Caenorhabditis elegans]|eukprot:NP_510842.2 FMRFamide Peptide Receptor family [Caenorhabditis elegans]
MADATTASPSTTFIAFIFDWALYFIQMLSHLLNGYFTAFFVFTGIILNLLSVSIFLRKERAGTPAIQYYLVTLTLWQTALLANAFLLYSFPNLWWGHLVSQGTYVYLYPYVYTFANTTHTGSVWIVLTLTIDRYLALCQPLKHRAIGKKRRVRRLMIVVSAMAVMFSIPRFFEVHVILICDEDQLSCVATIDRTELFDNRLYWTIYHVILAMVFVTLLPCLILFALTLRITIALRSAIAKRKSLCAPNSDIDTRCKSIKSSRYNSSRKDHKSNIMLVLVIAKFLVSDILPTVIDVLEHVVGQSAFMRSPLASLFVDISNFLIVLNCSSNFWVFFVWGKRFRRSCRKCIKSTLIGACIYDMAQWNNDSEVSLCAPSSFTTGNATKVYGSTERSFRYKRNMELIVSRTDETSVSRT